MKLTIKLNLNTLIATSFTETFYFYFDDITNLENCSESNVTGLDLYVTPTSKTMYVYINHETLPDHDEQDGAIVDLSDTSTWISFTCVVANTEYARLMEFIQKGIIEINQMGNTTLFAYTQNSENDAITKSITFVDVLEGKFNSAIGLKNITIDIKDYARNYNYIWIPALNRYYFIDSVEIISANISRLHLKEDVLMSWKDLILEQTAFVTRYEGSSDYHLVDDRLPVEDIPETTYYTPVTATGGSVVQFKYVMDTITGYTTKKPNILVVTMENGIAQFTDDTQNVKPPYDTTLPEIQTRRSPHQQVLLMNINDFGGVISGCIINDAPATFIKSILLLPFDLTEIFPDAGSGQADRTSHMYAGKYGLDASGFVEGTLSAGAPTFWQTKKGGSPYIVVADFWFNNLGLGNANAIENSYLDFSPNAQWEIYLPFVGWVGIDPKVLYEDRIMVYYTFDIDTGCSTAYIYNRTKDKMIWSGNCNIGMKLPLTTTNAEELARQKNATTLNLIMGMFSGLASVGLGAHSGNSNAMIGGTKGIIGGVVSAINSYSAMIEKAQMSYGSPDNALYGTKNVVIRKVKHAKVMDSGEEQDYKHLNGTPYKKAVQLNTLTSGKYIEVGTIHFDPMNSPIYQDEISEIVTLLHTGVVL